MSADEVVEQAIAAQLNGKLAESAAARGRPQILQVGAPMPLSMGRCADLYHDVRELRLAMEREVDEIKARETEVQEHIIRTVSASSDTGAAGLRYRAQVVKKPQPRIAPEAGWGIFCSWVRKNDRFDMLQKRLSEAVAMEFMEAERRVIPGLEVVLVPKLSVTKI